MPDWVWINNVIFPILGMGMGTFFGWTILKMINRHLERRAEERRLTLGGAGATEETQAQIDALREQVEALAERLDFNERLLAQQGERARLPRPRPLPDFPVRKHPAPPPLTLSPPSQIPAT